MNACGRLLIVYDFVYDYLTSCVERREMQSDDSDRRDPHPEHSDREEPLNERGSDADRHSHSLSGGDRRSHRSDSAGQQRSYNSGVAIYDRPSYSSGGMPSTITRSGSRISPDRRAAMAPLTVDGMFTAVPKEFEIQVEYGETEPETSMLIMLLF